MKLKLLAATALALWPAISSAAIKSQPVDYKDGDTALQGVLVYDDALTDKRPGVVVFPEWWGLTDYPKHRAEMLAKLGYVAFAADMYGKGVTTDNPDQAGKLATPIKSDPQLMRRRAALAVDQLKKSDHVDPDKLAAIGYCFGGSCALELARAGAPLKGVVSFHGDLVTKSPALPGDIKAKILVLTGGDDSFVPPDQVVDFASEMHNAHANWQINVYSGAKHAFTNPKADQYNIPQIGYNKQADTRSWNAMKLFFTELFGKVKPAGK
jgi:dienelactone hydrolase